MRAQALCTPFTVLPGNSSLSESGRRRVVLSLSTTLLKSSNSSVFFTVKACLSSSVSNKLWAKAEVPLWIRPHRACLVVDLPLKRVICRAHSLKVLCPLEQSRLRRDHKIKGSDLFGLAHQKAACFGYAIHGRFIKELV